MSTIVKGKSIVPVKTIKYGGKYDVNQIIDGDECKLEITTAQKGWRTYGKYLCRVVDIDGTVLKEEWLNTGDTFTLPALPTNHDRLVGTGWVSSCPDLNQAGTSTVVTKRDIMAGPVYETKTGMVEVIVEITEDIAPNIATEGHTVTVNLNGTKYWDYEGDKTITDTSNTHTYYSYGTYIIAIEGATGYVDSATIIVHSQAITKLYWSINGPNTLLKFIENYSPSNLREFSAGSGTISSTPASMIAYTALKSLILPVGCESVSTIGVRVPLEHLVIPTTVHTISGQTVRETLVKVLVIENLNGQLSSISTSGSSLNMLERVSFPVINTVDGSPFDLTSAMTTAYNLNIVDIGRVASFNGLRSNLVITELIFPTETVEIVQNGLRELFRLKRTVFNGNVSHIGSYNFYNCNNLQIIDFSNNTEVPTLDGDILGTNTPYCKIIVPDALYDNWIVATNWVTYASRIYKASEVNYDRT